MGNTILTIRLCVWAIAVVACVILVPHSANGQIYTGYQYDSHGRLQQYSQNAGNSAGGTGYPVTYEEWIYDNAGNRQIQRLTVPSQGFPLSPPTCNSASVSVNRGQTVTVSGLSTCSDPQGYAMSVIGVTPTVTYTNGQSKFITLLNNSTSANGTITISATSDATTSPNYDPYYTPGRTYAVYYTVQDIYGETANVGILVVIN